MNTIMYSKVLHFKVFKLVNPDEKMHFLAFTRPTPTHYLKTSKLKKQFPLNITYQRKRLWKGNEVASANEMKQSQHFVEKCSQKCYRVCPSRPTTWCLICKVGLCIEPYFKASFIFNGLIVRIMFIVIVIYEFSFKNLSRTKCVHLLNIEC